MTTRSTYPNNTSTRHEPATRDPPGSRVSTRESTVSRQKSRGRRPACGHRGGGTTRREHSAPITRLGKPLDLTDSAGIQPRSNILPPVSFGTQDIGRTG